MRQSLPDSAAHCQPSLSATGSKRTVALTPLSVPRLRSGLPRVLGRRSSHKSFGLNTLWTI